jgi:NADPH:quinone reductase-like Zn-dependent oxidoreductase
VYPNGIEAASSKRRTFRVQAFDMVASPRQFERLNRHLTEGRIRVPITARYSLGKAAQAYRRLARQHVLGWMVLQIRRDGARL